MQRSVERVDGVRNVELDLNSGRATVMFEKDRTASPADLWEAVKDSGFTPARIEIGGSVYKGPDPK